MKRLEQLLWAATLPARWYLRQSPVSRGKGLIRRRVIAPLAPKGNFDVLLPGGAVIELAYREELGLVTAIDGLFERAELEWLLSTRLTGVVVDVGANIGLFSCVAARLSDVEAVWSIEPLASNVHRLRNNIQRNDLDRVRVCHIALTDVEGEARLNIATDGAYGSLVPVDPGKRTARTEVVKTRTLDSLWRELSSPTISLIKIDVEGAEPNVLAGARQVLATCRPTLLVEANTPQAYRVLFHVLSDAGYHEATPQAFQRWNFLFRPDEG